MSGESDWIQQMSKLTEKDNVYLRYECGWFESGSIHIYTDFGDDGSFASIHEVKPPNNRPPGPCPGRPGRELFASMGGFEPSKCYRQESFHDLWLISSRFLVGMPMLPQDGFIWKVLTWKCWPRFFCWMSEVNWSWLVALHLACMASWISS